MAATKKLIILDRDGVINHDSDDYIKSPEEWRPIHGSLEAIAALHRAGYTVVVVTNQSGVGRGMYSEATLAAIHEKMLAAVEAAGGRLARIFYCPHSPEAGCDCRKPLPGMLTRVEEELGLSPVGAPLIGDKESDLELARRVGARPILVRSGYGTETLAAINDPGVECYDDLADAVEALISVAAE